MIEDYPFQPQIGGDLVIPTIEGKHRSMAGKIFAVEFPAWGYSSGRPLELYCYAELHDTDFDVLAEFLHNRTPEEQRSEKWKMWTVFTNPQRKV
jgi:hypothetical protein